MVTQASFCVRADAQPSCLARVLDVFAVHGQLPSRLVSRRGGEGGRDLTIDARLDSLPAGKAAAVALRLTRVVGVSSVRYRERRVERPAA